MTLNRTSHEAVADHLENLQKLVSCVTPSVVVAELYHPAPAPIPVTINNGEPVSLRGPSRFQFALRQSFIAVDSEQSSSWRVVVRSFSYELHDSDGREVLLYHWHPRGSSPVVTPHIHLEEGAQVGRSEIRDAHLPTGNISLNEILRVLIDEMRVRPLHSDWESILA